MWKIAVIEVDGRTVTLRSAEAAENAYLDGRLTENTRVFMRDKNGALTASTVQELEQFRTLLGLPEPQPHVDLEAAQSEEEIDQTADPIEDPLSEAPPPEVKGEETPGEDLATDYGRVDREDAVVLHEPSSDVEQADERITEESTNSVEASEESEAISAVESDSANTEQSSQSAALTGQAEAIEDEEQRDLEQPPIDNADAHYGEENQLEPAVSLETIGDEVEEVSSAKPDDAKAIEVAPSEELSGPEIDQSIEDSTDADVDEAPESGDVASYWNENRWLLLAIAVLLALVAGLAIALLSRNGDESAAETVEAVNAGEVFTGYAILDAPLFAEPNETGITGEELAYGQAVQLRALENNDLWRVINEGPLLGRYVPSQLISRVRPAAIERSQSGPLRFKIEVPVRSAPNLNSAIFQYANPSQPLQMIGLFRDNVGEEWAVVEIGNGPSLRPGYVSLNEAKGIEEAEADQDGRNERDARGTRDANQTKCAALSSSFDRLICQNPALASSESQMQAAYARAQQRFATAGQQMLPYSQFRARVESCRTAQCARDSIAGQIELLNSLTPTQPPTQSVDRSVDRSAQAQPKNNESRWIRSGDYPRQALREEREGTVRFSVTVDARGRVSSCSVTQSSGHADLDEATCRAVTRRARFEPARDTSGRAVSGQYSSQVNWRMR